MESGLFGLSGVVIGALLVQFLSRSSERKQWIRDCRKEEFRELLTALSKAYVNISLFRPVKDLPKEQLLEMYNLWAAALITIRDRLYISADVAELDLARKWIAADDAFKKDKSVDEFTKRYNELNSAIVEAARKHP